MNKLGVEVFKKEVNVGDELSVSTREYSYHGTVLEINDDSFVIDEGIMSFDVYYAHVWVYCKL
ncbi:MULTISPECIES: hypothetical protein [Bacillota]|uniref:hypothetical protein n=1 Tax=Bacillota TaxID=1239 RepID=UPI0039EEC4A1